MSCVELGSTAAVDSDQGEGQDGRVQGPAVGTFLVVAVDRVVVDSLAVVQR